MAEGEVLKLQNHLSLLREEYVKLQNKLADVEKKYQVASASAGQFGEDNFVSRLLKIVAELFNKELYSDLIINLDGSQEIRSHKFVLAARGDTWGVADLADISELDFTDINSEVALALLKWLYTDEINIQTDDTFLLELLRVATRFKLSALRNRCENALMSFVNMKNCIRFYQTADEMSADILKKHCSELISNHWNDFTSVDFSCLPAPLLYRMFKTKTEYPLHTAIKAKREDVVFLYLIEYDSQLFHMMHSESDTDPTIGCGSPSIQEHLAMLSSKLNEIDNRGDIPLDLALQSKQDGIAQTLVSHKANINKKDNSGKCLLHRAIKRGDEFAASFLIQNNADINLATHMDKDTPLHMVASFNPDVTMPEVMDGMTRIAKQLLSNGGDPNAQDSSGSTPVHAAIFNKNMAAFKVFLENRKLNLELQNSDGHTALWLALQVDSENVECDAFGMDSFASQLLNYGSSPDATNAETGDTLLHLATRSGNEIAAIFLASRGASLNMTNSRGESPLHIASMKGLTQLVKILLDKGANPNMQTKMSDKTLDLTRLTMDDNEAPPVCQQTALHLAVLNQQHQVVEVFLQHKAAISQAGDQMKIVPNFNVKDSNGETVLGLALWNAMHTMTDRLLSSGANINEHNTAGLTLLHQAIQKQDTTSAQFLLDHKVDINIKTPDNETPLQLAIQRHLPSVVDALCSHNIAMNIVYDNGDCPLWHALDSGQEDIAKSLVMHGCNVDMWGKGPGGCEQTLLHRAIDENNETVACFLIRNGCTKNSPRRPGPNGSGEEEARDGQTPLHLACAWGLEILVQTLMELNAEVNFQDAEGKTPIHIAIENQHVIIISLMLAHPNLNLMVRDKAGLTPFAVAMTTKNNKAAQSILNREATAAEQVDQKGRNFLHTAIQKSDIESVLFLIGISVNVNSRVQDSQQLAPLHLAVMSGSEIIVRNLILAGAGINDKTLAGETALHIAATTDQAVIASVLLENNIKFDAVDEHQNNALHIAVLFGNLNTVRVLLTESRINAETVNAKGQNTMHVLGQYGKDNAAAMFDLFRQSMPDYPLDIPTTDGNTVLLFAYMNGNGNLCRAIVRAGSCLGTVNKQGVSIFNFPVATRQLLFKLLDMLSKEPPWSEGENCLECNIKFNIKTRRHHCRHCGRLVCGKCSSKDMPIVKYNLNKPVRVCDICFDVLAFKGAL